MEKLHSLLSEFEKTLETSIENVWEISNIPKHLKALSETTPALIESILAIGDHNQKQLAEGVSYPSFACSYLWTDQAKSFMILWRDVLFQVQKGQILFLEEKVSEDALAQLKKNCELRVSAAAKELIRFYSDSIKGDAIPIQEQKKRIERWKLQHNPWPTYSAQLNELQSQCSYLHQQYLELEAVSAGFWKIRHAIHENLRMIDEEKKGFITQVKEIEEFIHENLQPPDNFKPKKVVARLEDLKIDIELPNNLRLIKEIIASETEKFREKTLVSIDTTEGLINRKEIFFRRATQQWIEAEIMPLIYEIWELVEKNRNTLKMTFVNMYNHAVLLVGEQKEVKPLEVDPAEICQPLESFVKKMEDLETSLVTEKKELIDRIETEFQLADVYDDKRDFLPLPLQSTLRNITQNQNQLVVKTRDWLINQIGILRKVRKTVEEEETLSTSEKVLRFIQTHSPDEKNGNYTNIFLTKGYIGESFWVGRKDELIHIEKLINNWKKGYRGGVLLTGQRFSGKSLFGELVANRFFYKRTIRLRPEVEININGRKFTPGYNLGEAFDFIKKYTQNVQSLIWIDDLELWWDAKTSYGTNVRRLKRFMENPSHDNFCIVSMSNWQRHHLTRFHHIDLIFHSVINLDRMSISEVEDAILIRHGATHKKLVDSEGLEIMPNQFQKMVRRIYKTSRGNVGESLNRWANSTQKLNDDDVIHVPLPNYSLPDFKNPDIELLLTALMMRKRTNEYRLRKLFGPPFADKYKSLLQQLLSVGLLTRNIDGWLEVNQVGANELGRMLESKKSIKFHR